MKKMLINNKNFTILEEGERKNTKNKCRLSDNHRKITLEDYINESERKNNSNHIFNIIWKF